MLDGIESAKTTEARPLQEWDRVP